MKEIKITTKKGTEIVIRATVSHEWSRDDYYCTDFDDPERVWTTEMLRTTNYMVWTTVKAEAIVNGKVFATVEDKDYCKGGYHAHEMSLDLLTRNSSMAGCKVIDFGTVGNQKILFALKDEDVDRYDNWMREIYTEGLTAGQQSFIDTLIKSINDEVKEEELKNAKRIVRLVEEVGYEVYETYEDAEKAAKKYNDTYNEGGMGFIPEMITREEYEQAKKVMEGEGK